MQQQVTEVLRAAGQLHLRDCSEAMFSSLARHLGVVVDQTLVQVQPGGRTYLSSPGPIPLHTDHPMADFIGWRCEAPDPHGGTSVLVDSRPALARLPVEVRAQLSRTRLPAAVRPGDPADLLPVLSSSKEDAAVFFAPWLRPPTEELATSGALAALRAALAEEESRSLIQLKLAPGDVLLVDNHRMLHGRTAVSADSPRRLRRLWIRARG